MAVELSAFKAPSPPRRRHGCCRVVKRVLLYLVVYVLYLALWKCPVDRPVPAGSCACQTFHDAYHAALPHYDAHLRQHVDSLYVHVEPVVEHARPIVSSARRNVVKPATQALGAVYDVHLKHHVDSLTTSVEKHFHEHVDPHLVQARSLYDKHAAGPVEWLRTHAHSLVAHLHRHGRPLVFRTFDLTKAHVIPRAQDLARRAYLHLRALYLAAQQWAIDIAFPQLHHHYREKVVPHIGHLLHKLNPDLVAQDEAPKPDSTVPREGADINPETEPASDPVPVVDPTPTDEPAFPAEPPADAQEAPETDTAAHGTTVPTPSGSRLSTPSGKKAPITPKDQEAAVAEQSTPAPPSEAPLPVDPADATIADGISVELDDTMQETGVDEQEWDVEVGGDADGDDELYETIDVEELPEEVVYETVATTVTRPGHSSALAGDAKATPEPDIADVSSPRKLDWIKRVERTAKGAIRNLQDDADVEQNRLAAAAKPDFMRILRDLSAFGEKSAGELGKLADKVEAGEDVVEAELYKEFETRVEKLKSLSIEVRNRAEVLAEETVEHMDKIRAEALDALDDYFDVVLLEAGREASQVESDDGDGWASWKSYHALKKYLKDIRHDVETHEIDMSVANTALGESQDAAVLLSQEFSKHFATLRAKAQFLIQQKLLQDIEKSKAAGHSFPETVADAVYYEVDEEGGAAGTVPADQTDAPTNEDYIVVDV